MPNLPRTLVRRLRSRKGFAAAALPLLSLFPLLSGWTGCATDLAGTVSGTENTITVAQATLRGGEVAVAEVRFYDAAALPTPVSGKKENAVVVASRTEAGFTASLPAGRLWTAELIGTDSTYRLWIDSVGSVDGPVKLQAGPLLRTASLEGTLTGELGEETWIGIVGTDRFASVDKEGRFALNHLVAAPLRMVTARKLRGDWVLNTVSGWSRPTGEVALPPKLPLPADGSPIDAWGCTTSSSLIEAPPREGAPRSDLYYTLRPGGEATALLRIDLCNGTWGEVASLPTAEPLLLFGNGTGRWTSLTSDNLSWDLTLPETPQTDDGDFKNELGLLSTAGDSRGFASYFYRPAGNRVTLFDSFDQMRQDRPTLEWTLDRSDTGWIAMGDNRVFLIDSEGGVTPFRRENGTATEEVWRVSSAATPLFSALRTGEGRWVLLSGTPDAPRLSIVEEKTGELLSVYTGLPSGISGLTR